MQISVFLEPLPKNKQATNIKVSLSDFLLPFCSLSLVLIPIPAVKAVTNLVAYNPMGLLPYSSVGQSMKWVLLAQS